MPMFTLPGHDIVARYERNSDTVSLVIPTNNPNTGFNQYTVTRGAVTQCSYTPTHETIPAVSHAASEPVNLQLAIPKEFLRSLAGAIGRDEAIAALENTTDLEYWENSMNEPWVHSR